MKKSNKQEISVSTRIAPANRNVDPKQSSYKNYKRLKDVPLADKKVIIITIFIIVFIFAFLFLSCFFALALNGTNTYAKGIKIMGVDVSGLTKEKARDSLEAEIAKRITTDFILDHNNETYTLNPNDLEAVFHIDEALDDAYNIGRCKNIVQNNFDIIKLRFSNKEFTPTVTFNNGIFLAFLDQLQNRFSDCISNASYIVDGMNLVVYKGRDGYVIDSSQLKRDIEKELVSEVYSNNHLELPVIWTKAQGIDISKIHEEVYVPAVDASFTTNPYKITSSSNGIDFDMTLEEASNSVINVMQDASKDQLVIPLKTLYPNVTTDDLGYDAFPNEISTFSTNYGSVSSYARSVNIEICASYVDGKVLMPGEVFSFNDVVGDTIPQRGYKPAPAYSGGQTVMEYGGGICQVSSTLYNAVILANLEIVERYNHMFPVSYVPVSRDATVYYGSCDFLFKNNRNYPIKISSKTTNGNMIVTIYGMKEENEPEISIISYRTGSTSTGFYSTAIKIQRLNGEEISRETLSYDHYRNH